VHGARQRRLHQRERVEVKLLSQTLDGLQGHIPLAALDRAHIRAVDAQEFGELLLGQSQDLPVATQIASDGPLKLSDHVINARALLLFDLHTYE
jgi:hypothetical protein